MQDQVSVFMSPSDRMVNLNPQALGSLFITMYVLKGYDGGILPFLHAVNHNTFRMIMCH
jgi:hypothetical protein